MPGKRFYNKLPHERVLPFLFKYVQMEGRKYETPTDEWLPNALTQVFEDLALYAIRYGVQPEPVFEKAMEFVRRVKEVEVVDGKKS